MTATTTTPSRRREPLGVRRRWGTSRRARAALAADRAPLDAALEARAPSEVPCRADQLPTPIWTSEDEAVQRAAALACLECPVLRECRRYALAHPAEAGVLGGLTERDRVSGRRLSMYRKQFNERTNS